jgi:hypothetical protein
MGADDKIIQLDSIRLIVRDRPDIPYVEILASSSDGLGVNIQNDDAIAFLSREQQVRYPTVTISDDSIPRVVRWSRMDFNITIESIRSESLNAGAKLRIDKKYFSYFRFIIITNGNSFNITPNRLFDDTDFSGKVSPLLNPASEADIVKVNRTGHSDMNTQKDKK